MTEDARMGEVCENETRVEALSDYLVLSETLVDRRRRKENRER